MNQRTLTNEEFDGYTWPDGWEEVFREIVDHTRWAVWDRVVAKDSDGRYWETFVENPATEHQEIDPIEEWDLYEVFPVEKKVVVYEYSR